MEGCDGETTCGSVPEETIEHRSGIMSTFTFQLRVNDVLLENFQIVKSSERRVGQPAGSSNGQSVGCGGTIDWAKMRPVTVPSEFRQDPKINTADVDVLPKEAGGVVDRVNQMLRDGGRRLTGRRN